MIETRTLLRTLFQLTSPVVFKLYRSTGTTSLRLVYINRKPLWRHLCFKRRVSGWRGNRAFLSVCLFYKNVTIIRLVDSQFLAYRWLNLYSLTWNQACMTILGSGDFQLWNMDVTPSIPVPPYWIQSPVDPQNEYFCEIRSTLPTTA